MSASNALMNETPAPTLVVGARVRLKEDVDRFPHFIAPAGATGTISGIEAGITWVKMDEHIPGAEEWDNEIQFLHEEGGDDMSVLEPL